MINKYKKINTLKKRLQNREIILMNGATGTEILNRGFKTTLPCGLLKYY